MGEKEKQIRAEMTSSFVDHVNDPAFIPVSINKEALIGKSIVTEEIRERFADQGQFCCRVPGTWEQDGKTEKILLTPLKNVFEADGGKTYIAFLDKRHLPLILNAGDGTPAREFFGITTPEFAEKMFKPMEEADLTPERIVVPVKALEKVTEHIKQPTPPVKVR